MAQRRRLEGGGGEGGAEDQFASVSVLFHTGMNSPGGHCHSTLSLAASGCHSVGIYILILLPLLPFLSNDSVALGQA